MKPGRVPWPEGGLQAPHLLVGAFARGLLKRVVTRIYFPDEGRPTDRPRAAGSTGSAPRLVAVAEDGGLRFDIRLQGPAQTTFFAV